MHDFSNWENDPREVPVHRYLAKKGEKYGNLLILTNPTWKRNKNTKQKVQTYQFVWCKCLLCKTEFEQMVGSITSGKKIDCGCVGKVLFRQKIAKCTLAENGFKKCAKCQIYLPVDKFHLRKSEKDGYQINCKTCNFICRNEYKLKEKFDYLTKLENINCEICQKTLYLPGDSNNNQDVTCIDHNHNSNKVRGILCMKCNAALGFLNEDIKILNNMIKYIDKYSN